MSTGRYDTARRGKMLTLHVESMAVTVDLYLKMDVVDKWFSQSKGGKCYLLDCLNSNRVAYLRCTRRRR